MIKKMKLVYKEHLNEHPKHLFIELTDGTRTPLIFDRVTLDHTATGETIVVLEDAVTPQIKPWRINNIFDLPSDLASVVSTTNKYLVHFAPEMIDHLNNR